MASFSVRSWYSHRNYFRSIFIIDSDIYNVCQRYVYHLQKYFFGGSDLDLLDYYG